MNQQALANVGVYDLDAMINDLMGGLAIGLPVALAVALAVVWQLFKSDRAYRRLGDKVGKDGYTELMCAAWGGDLKSVRSALADGADINAQDQDGMTALMHACTRADNEKVLKELIDAGANAAIRRTSGERAVDLAYNRKHLKQVALLNEYPSE